METTSKETRPTPQPSVFPTGIIVAYGGTIAPEGWALCDGKSVSKAIYKELFKVVANSFGGEGESFNLPDLRGRFLRGLDGEANVDPDKDSRTAMNPGGSTGNLVGSVQGDAFQSHRHGVSWTNGTPHAGGAPPDKDNGGQRNRDFATSLTVLGPTTDGSNGTPRLSSETRPVNAYMNYIIKL